MARDYRSDVSTIISTTWDTAESENFPVTSDVKLAGGAKWVSATYLYADLANSSKMAKTFDRRVTAKIIKSFLQSATYLVQENSGRVISFDGDRIMGVFTGGSKNTNAVRCALNINWVVSEVIRSKFESSYSSVKEADFEISHGVGVDTGRALIVRGGVRGNNDLISIGRAPNLAAKLSDLRNGYTTRITEDVYNSMSDDVKYAHKDGSNMWESASWSFLDDEVDILRSTWWRKPGA
ncbi:adenylate/guanylate cyclase domain-containing protein [Leisingera aquaemixtae]|uniref:Adenylate and Guanylate cyclase catalytic domain protein n=1 Tax=Leisingera aquaemixtae TaxID=1396826 RepID=A0A0P1H8Y7_9RHOB|nr:adenylate/guanylate cyclase domain-containing protein [Leisingera aquaemixtae]CUH99615.1 Adenylate and Guanylate cyclase catalytic domain protein [Leisingera aquaemixtae]